MDNTFLRFLTGQTPPAKVDIFASEGNLLHLMSSFDSSLRKSPRQLL